MRLAVTAAAVLLLVLGPGEAGEAGAVTCGSVVKLLNPRHGVRLHSHDVRYGSGSGQQSVTGVTSVDDSNSYWRVRGKSSSVCERGTPVQCGQTIRLTHINTGRNLHSHHFTSPLSGNQSEVRFKHASTEVLLSVTGEQYGRPIHGQREVHGLADSGQDSFWKAMEGIFVKPTEWLKAGLYHTEL
ncbi:hypothetical protein E2320_018040 [Naja naja]|nr:hypothetical protein E2320_018040 [Naja naja]